jgi:hypothetical protein
MKAQSSSSRAELDQKIAACENRAADQLSSIRNLEREWRGYREIMRADSTVYERAGRDIGGKNYFVSKGLAARKEVDAYVRGLAAEVEELLEVTARRVQSESEAELERLRKERAGVTWG